jgi:hypothetical protein
MKIRIYTTIILPVLLYGRETWSLTSRKERNAYRLLAVKPEGKQPLGRPKLR